MVLVKPKADPEGPISEVSQIHFQGGSILRTSRANPTRNRQGLQNVVGGLRKLRVNNLVTVGGDDTAFSALEVAKVVNRELQIVHVPKTIDNDLPLPGNMPTFRFETARHFGTAIVRNLMEDSRTTNRWYFIVTMGRSSGHLALGIAKAARGYPGAHPRGIRFRSHHPRPGLRSTGKFYPEAKGYGPGKRAGRHSRRNKTRWWPSAGTTLALVSLILLALKTDNCC